MVDVVVMRRGSGWVVVAVAGEVDFRSADSLYDQALRLMDGDAGCLVLDFSQVAFCDSSGISALVGIMRELRARGGGLIVAAAPDRVTRAMRQMGMHHFIPVHDSVATALDTLPGPGADVP
ncbi:STAS domain-containing protein [Streptomyces sp. NPDC056704]|uniref:STAS domain-containing protein n=1 Tax=Streptomyces TaxID=1883 RepID=UPI0036AC1663